MCYVFVFVMWLLCVMSKANEEQSESIYILQRFWLVANALVANALHSRVDDKAVG